VRRIFRIVVLVLLAVNCFAFPAHASGGRSHAVTLTMLPDETFYAAVSSGIRRAKKEIRGCFYLFKATGSRGNLPRTLVDDLIAASRRGVDVVIELERDGPGNGSVYEQNRQTASLLSEGGVRVRFDGAKTTTHVKALVVDGRYVYLGSHNLTQSALKFNNELSVMVDSREFAEQVTTYLDNL